MKFKAMALIVLFAFMIGVVALTSGQAITSETNQLFDFKGFLSHFSGTMVVFGRPIGGGPGSD